MASDKDALCVNDPNFAVICAFMQRFSSICGIEFPNIQDLQNMLENTEEVAPELLDLHAKLLRRSRLVVHIDKWEKSLIKFCHFYSRQDAWEIERFGYKNAQLSAKIRALKVLLESQFDNNAKFKNVVNAVPANELRSQPLGKDKFGNAYWSFLDDKCNIKVFQEHLDEETFKLVASNRDELVKLINRLQGNEPVLPSLEGLVDEDSSSNSLPNKNDMISTEKNNEIQISQHSNSSNSHNENIEKSVVEVVKPNIIESKKNIVALNEEEDDEEDDDDDEEEDDEDDEEDDDESEEEEEIQEKDKNRPYTNKIILKPIKEPPKEEIKIVRPSLLSSKQPSKKPERNEHNKLKRNESDDDEMEHFSKRSKIERPTLLIKGNKPKTGKYEDLDDEDDYDDEEEIEEEEEEELDENDDEEDDDDEYSDEIEDPVVHVKGLGSGHENQGTFQDMLNKNHIDADYGEVIEEHVMYIVGEGSGAECNVGNPEKSTSDASKSDTPIFFFGQPGCLKLSPIKSQTAADASSKTQNAATSSTKSLSLVNYDIESSSSNSGDATNDDVKSDEVDNKSENVEQSFQLNLNENCTKNNSISIEINENKIIVVKDESNKSIKESQESDDTSTDNKEVPISLLTSKIDNDLAKLTDSKKEIIENDSGLSDLKVEMDSIEIENEVKKDEVQTDCLMPSVSELKDSNSDVVQVNKSDICVASDFISCEQNEEQVETISTKKLDDIEDLECSRNLDDDNNKLTPETNIIEVSKDEILIDNEESSNKKAVEENEISVQPSDVDNIKICDAVEDEEVLNENKVTLDAPDTEIKSSIESEKTEALVPEEIRKLKTDDNITSEENVEVDEILARDILESDSLAEINENQVEKEVIDGKIKSELEIDETLSDDNSTSQCKDILPTEIAAQVTEQDDTNIELSESNEETIKVSEDLAKIANEELEVCTIDTNCDSYEQKLENSSTVPELPDVIDEKNEDINSNSDKNIIPNIENNATIETEIIENLIEDKLVSAEDVILEKSNISTDEIENVNKKMESGEESVSQTLDDLNLTSYFDESNDSVVQKLDKEEPVSSNSDSNLSTNDLSKDNINAEILADTTHENIKIPDEMNATAIPESPNPIENLSDTTVDVKDNLDSNIAIKDIDESDRKTESTSECTEFKVNTAESIKIESPTILPNVDNNKEKVESLSTTEDIIQESNLTFAQSPNDINEGESILSTDKPQDFIVDSKIILDSNNENSLENIDSPDDFIDENSNTNNNDFSNILDNKEKVIEQHSSSDTSNFESAESSNTYFYDELKQTEIFESSNKLLETEEIKNVSDKNVILECKEKFDKQLNEPTTSIDTLITDPTLDNSIEMTNTEILSNITNDPVTEMENIIKDGETTISTVNNKTENIDNEDIESDNIPIKDNENLFISDSDTDASERLKSENANENNALKEETALPENLDEATVSTLISEKNIDCKEEEFPKENITEDNLKIETPILSMEEASSLVCFESDVPILENKIETDSKTDSHPTQIISKECSLDNKTCLTESSSAHENEIYMESEKDLENAEDKFAISKNNTISSEQEITQDCINADQQDISENISQNVDIQEESQQSEKSCSPNLILKENILDESETLEEFKNPIALDRDANESLDTVNDSNLNIKTHEQVMEETSELIDEYVIKDSESEINFDTQSTSEDLEKSVVLEKKEYKIFDTEIISDPIESNEQKKEETENICKIIDDTKLEIEDSKEICEKLEIDSLLPEEVNNELKDNISEQLDKDTLLNEDPLYNDHKNETEKSSDLSSEMTEGKIFDEQHSIANQSLIDGPLTTTDTLKTDTTLTEKTDESLNPTIDNNQKPLNQKTIHDNNLTEIEKNLEGSDISEIENFSDEEFEENNEQLQMTQANINEILTPDNEEHERESIDKSEVLPTDIIQTSTIPETKISYSDIAEPQQLIENQEKIDISISECDMPKASQIVDNDSAFISKIVEEKAEKSPIPIIEITKSDEPIIEDDLEYEPHKLSAPKLIEETCSVSKNQGDTFGQTIISREIVPQIDEQVTSNKLPSVPLVVEDETTTESAVQQEEITPIYESQQDQRIVDEVSSIPDNQNEILQKTIPIPSDEKTISKEEEVSIESFNEVLNKPDQQEAIQIIQQEQESIPIQTLQKDITPVIPVSQELLPNISIEEQKEKSKESIPVHVLKVKDLPIKIEANITTKQTVFSKESLPIIPDPQNVLPKVSSFILVEQNELLKETPPIIPVYQKELPKESLVVQKTKSRLEKIVEAIELKQMQQQTTVDVQSAQVSVKESRKRRFSEDEVESNKLENTKKKIIENTEEKEQTYNIEESKLPENLQIASSSARKRKLLDDHNLENDNSSMVRTEDKIESDLVNDVSGKRIKIRRHINLELRKEIESKRKLETESSSGSDSEQTRERSRPRLPPRSRPSSALMSTDSERKSPAFLNILDSEKRPSFDPYNEVGDYSLQTLKKLEESNVDHNKIVNLSIDKLGPNSTDINTNKVPVSSIKLPEAELLNKSKELFEKNVENPILSQSSVFKIEDSDNKQDVKHELFNQAIPDTFDDVDLPSPESLAGYSDAAVSTISDEDDEKSDLEDLTMKTSVKVEAISEDLSTKISSEPITLNTPILQPNLLTSTNIIVPIKDESIINEDSSIPEKSILPSTSIETQEKDPLEVIIPARTEIKEIVTTTLLGSIEEPLDAPFEIITKESIIKQLTKVVKKQPAKKSEPKSKVTSKSYKKPNEVDKNLDKVESEIVKKAETKNQTTPRKGRRGNRVLGLEIDASLIVENTETAETPVRQSRRIAQLKIKEEAERRKQEEIALQKLKEESEKKKQQKISPDEDSKHYMPSDSESNASEVESVKKSGKKKRSKNSGKPSGWNESSAEESESEQEEEDDLDEREESDGGRSHLFKSDHEFSPESDIEDETQAVPMKRARTVKKDPEDELEEDDNPNHACQTCGKHDHPEWILLCDNCDKGYHCSCLKPLLFLIPEGDWFCPTCQHEKLIDSFNDYLAVFDDMLKAKEQEENRKKRLIYTNISMENVLSPKRDARKKSRSKSRSVKEHSSSDEDLDSHKRRSKRVKDTREQYSDEDDESSDSDAPIYKFRKRRQTVVSYRFNDYDDLINSAIKEEMDEVKGAGNLGRGKDISTIIEADKEEKMRQKELDDQSDKNDSDKKLEDDEIKVEGKEIGEENPEDKKASSSDSDSEPIIRRNQKKKSRKLTTLDVSSDEDNGSDEDFKESSPESEEEYSASSGSESSMEMELKRRRGRNRGETRRSTRERKSRFDREFINDDSEDTNTEAPKIKKKKREDSDFSDFDDDEDEEEEDVDSNDLCDDTDSDSEASDGAWRPKKKKKVNRKAQNRDISKRPPPPPSRKKPKKKEDDEKSFKAGITIKKSENVENEEKSDGEVSRRTRGKKITYIEDYESSDDGIKPGVKRPDTPPEERERFIKKQEEIKRMLAAKNTEPPVTAPKIIELPPLDVQISAPSLPDNIAEPVPDSISTVPLQVIQSAKALDLDFNRSKHTDSEFDNSLPEDFNPEDMDEEEIAKMMEEEDFAQQQLKLAGEVIRNKKLKEEKLKQGKPFSTDELKIIDTQVKPEPKKRKRKSKAELLQIESITKPENLTTPVIQAPLMTPIVTNTQLPLPTHTSIIIPSTIHAPLPPTAVQLNIPIISGPSTSEQVLLTAANPVTLVMQSHAPVHVQLHTPPPHLQAHSSPSHILPLHTGQGVIKSPYIPVMTNQETIIPTTVLSVQPSPIIHTENPALPGINPASVDTAPVKKRGRRKKITPLREDLLPASSHVTDLSSMANSQLKAKLIAGDPKNNPILAERLVSSPDTNKLSIAAPPQLYTIGGGATPSVITRLPQPQRGSMPAPYGAQGSMPPRFYGPPQIRNPPMSVSPHLIRSPFGPNQTPPLGGSPSGSPSAAHYLPPDHRQSLPPPHGMYRQATSMYGGHSFAPGPPSMHIPLHDPGAPSIGIRGGPPPVSGASTTIEYQGKESGRQRLQAAGVLNKKFAGLVAPPYCAPQYGGYYSPPQQTGPPNQTPPYDQYSIVKTGPPPPPTSHPDIIAAAAAATGGPPPPVAIPYSGPPPTDEERTSTSEFSGLVSYFSSQQDDLDT